MGAYRAIQKNFFNDPFEIKRKYPPIYHIYETFLYEEIKKGAMPKYKIKGCNKKEVEYYVDDLINAYNLKSAGIINHWISNIDTASYSPPICINIETGEIL